MAAGAAGALLSDCTLLSDEINIGLYFAVDNYFVEWLSNIPNKKNASVRFPCSGAINLGDMSLDEYTVHLIQNKVNHANSIISQNPGLEEQLGKRLRFSADGLEWFMHDAKHYKTHKTDSYSADDIINFAKNYRLGSDSEKVMIITGLGLYAVSERKLTLGQGAAEPGGKYAVVSHWRLLPGFDYVFSHELLHLIGAKHSEGPNEVMNRLDGPIIDQKNICRIVEYLK